MIFSIEIHQIPIDPAGDNRGMLAEANMKKLLSNRCLIDILLRFNPFLNSFQIIKKIAKKLLTISPLCAIIRKLSTRDANKNAAIAQSVERILGKDEVASSNLASSSRDKLIRKDGLIF